jgi:hypothetical protein
MKRTKIILTALAISLSIGQAMAQKVRMLEGSLESLKGVSKMNVRYDYEKMGVGKFETEQEYLDKKTKDYNEKEPGRGNTWAKSWKADRKNKFQPQFTELFEKYADITIGDLPNEKYTLIFITKYMEPGFNIYVTRKNAEIDGEAWIVETANPDHVIAKMSVLNCPGRTMGGNDYDTGTRLQEAYAVAGKGLGKFISKEIK